MGEAFGESPRNGTSIAHRSHGEKLLSSLTDRFHRMFCEQDAVLVYAVGPRGWSLPYHLKVHKIRYDEGDREATPKCP